METKAFPVIDPVATGDNIRRLREERGMSVKDLQRFFGFEEPRAVYKWQKGETLPSVDNLYALGILLGVPLEAILIPRKKHGPAYKEQQENSCCSVFFRPFRVRRTMNSSTNCCLRHPLRDGSRSGRRRRFSITRIVEMFRK